MLFRSDPGGRRTIHYCMDSGYLATDYCAMDPRGSRIASGSIFPESFPEGQNCPYHTAESIITVCLDCPVLKDDGSETGLYYQAGEFCPEESRKEICLPNFNREQIGSAAAGDAIWDYTTASGYGTCTLHTEEQPPVVDPTDPNNPIDPGSTTDPNSPFIPNLPIPGGTAEPSDPDIPDHPTDLPPPPGFMAG